MTTKRHVVVATAVAFSALFATILFWRTPFLLSLLLAVIAVFFLIYRRDKKLVAIYIFGFICGPATEIAAIHAGAWQYASPIFLGIPLWLPFLWGLAAMFIGFAYSAITTRSRLSQ